MSTLAINTLRVLLAGMLVGTTAIQVGIAAVLITGADPEDGSTRLTALRIVTLVGMIVIQAAVLCIWRLVTMTKRGTVFSAAAFGYVDGVIASIVAAAAVWFAATAIGAPDQADDPGVVVIMAGIGVAVLGVALLVYVLRTLLAQAVARDAEADALTAELDGVI
ncbi:MAG: DUF2975 domain-containing protein [Gordonia sp. (in: high G+C Gram-positive bacteria)]|uniref:DUF2975 domain-containing protein n=1 Tax=Gordonia sp. (in: high G+C Gram-positive bacteria) TaxID=84139 RepID=UPI0039E6613E